MHQRSKKHKITGQCERNSHVLEILKKEGVLHRKIRDFGKMGVIFSIGNCPKLQNSCELLNY